MGTNSSLSAFLECLFCKDVSLNVERGGMSIQPTRRRIRRHITRVVSLLLVRFPSWFGNGRRDAAWFHHDPTSQSLFSGYLGSDGPKGEQEEYSEAEGDAHGCRLEPRPVPTNTKAQTPCKVRRKGIHGLSLPATR